MNNQEKVKAAVEKLLEAEQATKKSYNASVEAKRAYDAACDAEEKAKLEVARQIHNVCPNKDVVYGERIYKRQCCGTLVIEGWDGVVLQ